MTKEVKPSDSPSSRYSPYIGQHPIPGRWEAFWMMTAGALLFLLALGWGLAKRRETRLIEELRACRASASSVAAPAPGDPK